MNTSCCLFSRVLVVSALFGFAASASGAEDATPGRPIAIFSWSGPWTNYDLDNNQEALMTHPGDSHDWTIYPSEASIAKLRHCDIAYTVNHGGEISTHPFPWFWTSGKMFPLVDLKFSTAEKEGPSLILSWGCDNGRKDLIGKYAKGMGILPESQTKVFIAPQVGVSIDSRIFPVEFFREFGKGDVTAEDAARRAFEIWNKNFPHPEEQTFDDMLALLGNKKLTLNQIRTNLAARALFATVRRDDRNRRNQIVVTSDALEKLDPKLADQGLVFTLYRSQSAAGPFTEATAGMVFSDQPVAVEEIKDQSVRISKREFCLVDSERFSDAGLEHNPVHYRVGMRTINWDTRKEGPESLSSITPRGKVIIQPRPGPELFARDGSSWLFGAAAMTLQDQRFDFAGAHFTVTAGSWTGHFWSDRARTAPDGTKTLWSDERPTGLSIPATLDEQSVTIQATAPQAKATLTVKVPAVDARVLAEAKSRAEGWKTFADKAVAERRKRGEKLREILPFWEQAANTLGPDEMLYLNGVFTLEETSTQTPEEVKNVTGNGRLNREEVQAKVKSLRARLEACESGESFEEEQAQRSIAAANCDYKAMLAVAQRVPARLKAERDRSRRFADAPAGAKESDSVPHLKDLVKAYQDVQDAALLAGDSAAFAEASVNRLTATIALVEQREASANDVAAGLQKMAEGIVLLTGNQSAAAAIYSRAGEVPSLPSWWPANYSAPKGGASLQASDLQLLEKESQHAIAEQAKPR